VSAYIIPTLFSLYIFPKVFRIGATVLQGARVGSRLLKSIVQSAGNVTSRSMSERTLVTANLPENGAIALAHHGDETGGEAVLGLSIGDEIRSMKLRYFVDQSTGELRLGVTFA
jgi:hypothetical protein